MQSLKLDRWDAVIFAGGILAGVALAALIGYYYNQEMAKHAEADYAAAHLQPIPDKFHGDEQRTEAAE